MVYYSYWKNGTLVINKHEIGGSVNYRSGLLDHQNNVLFYHTGSVPIPGGNVTGLYQQCLSANATWGPEWAISGQSKVGYYKYAVSAGNNIVSGWQSAFGAPVVLDLWDNCVSIKTKLSASHPQARPLGEHWPRWPSATSPRKFAC